MDLASGIIAIIAIHLPSKVWVKDYLFFCWRLRPAFPFPPNLQMKQR